MPRILHPGRPVLAGLVDMAVGFVVLIGIMAWYGVAIQWQIVTLPFFILFAIVTSIAVTLWLSALNVKYRDVQYTVPFLSQAWFFVTPVAYSALDLPTGDPHVDRPQPDGGSRAGVPLGDSRHRGRGRSGT